MRKLAYLAILGLVLPVFLIVLASGAHAFRVSSAPSMDAGRNEKTLNIEVISGYDIVNSGSAIPLTVEVRDEFDVPVEGVTVVIMTGSGEYRNVLTTDASGRAGIEFSSSTDTEVTYRLVITAEKAGFRSDIDSFGITVFPVQLEGAQADVSIVLSAMMVAAALSTEAGKYGMFKMLIFPLYTRLKKDEILDHFVRGQIYGYVMTHPGDHYNAIMEGLNITNGTLSHHLRTLEVQGFIKSVRDGAYRRFYPMDMKVPSENGTRLSDLQVSIMDLIRKGNGITQNEIARALNVSQQCVSYNLRMLHREGVLGIERLGRERKYYMIET